MLPLKPTLVPRVEEDPIAQNTLEALAPLIRRTWALLLTVRADPTWKIQTALASPWASRVRPPLTAMVIVDPDVYTPGASIIPDKSASSVPGGRPVASLYARSKSAFAWAAMPAGSL